MGSRAEIVPAVCPATGHEGSSGQRPYRRIDALGARACQPRVCQPRVCQHGVVASSVRTQSEVAQAFHEELHPGQRTALISWLAFTATFGAVRAITYSIKDGNGPFRNVSVGGLHLHHYMWGILTVSVVGGVALRGEDRLRRHPAMATAYGAGLALIVDEFALLLDLEDVYWAKQGRLSVDLGIGLISSTGSILGALPVLRRLRNNHRG